MSSDEDYEIRITYLEDQLNKMNLVLSAQGRKIDEMTAAFTSFSRRLKNLEDGLADFGSGENPFSPSEQPPDGINR